MSVQSTEYKKVYLSANSYVIWYCNTLFQIISMYYTYICMFMCVLMNIRVLALHANETTARLIANTQQTSLVVNDTESYN